MKEITVYQCEICSQGYDSKSKAEQCEREEIEKLNRFKEIQNIETKLWNENILILEEYDEHTEEYTNATRILKIIDDYNKLLYENT